MTLETETNAQAYSYYNKSESGWRSRGFTSLQGEQSILFAWYCFRRIVQIGVIGQIAFRVYVLHMPDQRGLLRELAVAEDARELSIDTAL